MAEEEKRTPGQILLRLGFLLYAGAMLWLLFGQRLGSGIYEQQLASSINLTPLATIEMYLQMLHSSSAYLVRHAFINLVGNVVMFIPLGFFQPYLARTLRAFWKTLFCTFCLIILIEAVQYFTLLGTCDIDDLILNLAGAAAGYGIWRGYHR